MLLLRALRHADVKRGALVGFAWGLAGLALPARWIALTALDRAEGVGSAALALLVLALAPAAFGALLCWLRERGARAPLIAPLAWVAVEWLRGRVPLVPCSWFTLAHALADGAARPLCQACEIAGAAGLSLVVISSALLLEEALAHVPHRPSRATVYAVAGIGVPVIVWQLGFLLLVSAPPQAVARWGAFSVVVVQDASSPEAKVLLTARGLAKARSDATPGVDALVWPEGAWPRDPFATGTLAPELAHVGSFFDRAFVLGCERPFEGRLVPSVLALAPNGQPLGEHRAGGEASVVSIGKESLGLALGAELATDDATLALVKRGATLLVLATSEPAAWPQDARLQHVLLASLRVCEVRRPLVRASTYGPSFALDALARPYELLPDRGPGVILGRLSGGSELTLYARGGHLLAPLALFFTLAWVAGAAAQRRRMRDEAADDEESHSAAASSASR